jgi:hypothetical protein
MKVGDLRSVMISMDILKNMKKFFCFWMYRREVASRPVRENVEMIAMRLGASSLEFLKGFKNKLRYRMKASIFGC